MEVGNGSAGDGSESVGTGVLGGAVGAVEAVEVGSDGGAVADTDSPYDESGQENAGEKASQEGDHAASSTTGQVTMAPGQARV